MQQTTHATYSYLPIYIGYLILTASRSLVQAIPQEWLKKSDTFLVPTAKEKKRESGKPLLRAMAALVRPCLLSRLLKNAEVLGALHEGLRHHRVCLDLVVEPGDGGRLCFLRLLGVRLQQSDQPFELLLVGLHVGLQLRRVLDGLEGEDGLTDLEVLILKCFQDLFGPRPQLVLRGLLLNTILERRGLGWNTWQRIERGRLEPR